MRYGGNNHAPPVEQNLPSKRSHHHDNQRSRKKQKISSSQTETHIRIQTLEPDSTLTFAAHTHKHANSYDYNNQRRRRANFYDYDNQKRQRKDYRKSPSQREWTYSTHDVSNYNDKVVIVSYNILGVENATKHPELYRRVLPKYLDWEYRKEILCEEVKRYQPSILCFQEVDRFDDLNALLGKDGFIGVHKARSGEACDGCTMFWKSELFTLLHEENIEFQSFGLRNNVAQFCVFEMNQNAPDVDGTAGFPRDTSSRSLVVGNIHVLYNPKRGDIKLGQMRIFLEKAYELSRKWGCIPVVLAGDLNSLPQSAMYEFLASSKLHIQQHDRRQISGQICPSEYTTSRYESDPIKRPFVHMWTDEETMLATGSRVSYVMHHLKLSSAYTDIPGSSEYRDNFGEPLATSHHCKFRGTVDYIWHTPDLVAVKVLETLPIQSLKQTGGLPTEKWGSDHLALACELAFIDAAN